MKNNRPREPFVPPDAHAFLDKGLWAINEAVHMIVGWPKENLILSTITPLPENIKSVRSFYYLPEVAGVYYPESIKKIYFEVFNDLKKSIEEEALAAIYHHLDSGIFYLLRPQDVMLWALLKGYILPNDVQEALNIRQMKDSKSTKALEKKVRVKVSAQYLLSKNPDLNVTQICKDPLLISAQTAGLTGGSNGYHSDYHRMAAEKKRVEKASRVSSTVREAVDELFATKGRPGRWSKLVNDNPKRAYIPFPIPEVMHQECDGILRYHFPLLKIAIEALVYAKKDAVFDVLFIKVRDGYTFEELSQEFIDDAAFQIYLYQPPEIVLQLAKNAIYRIWSQLQDMLFYLQAEKMFARDDNKFIFQGKNKK